MTGELVTIVFADIERSTELLVERGDDAGRAAIERVVGTIAERAADYGGRVVKGLGDGAMLVFPAPRQAVTFAVALQRTLDGHVPAVRIGINTGEVSGGTDDPVGEAVSAAARIAAKAAGGEVVVSDVVRQLVGTVPGVAFVDRGRTRLKGFPDRWRLFSAAGSEQDVEAAPVFGRVDELALFDSVVGAAVAGRGSLVVVEGEGGIGTTHLVEAAASRARAMGARVLWAGADELELDRPGRLLFEWASALAVPLVTGPEADAGAAGFTLVTAIADAVEHAAARAPVVIVAEDLQWADELSLRGIASLLRRVDPLPIVAIVTMRAVPRPPLLDAVLRSGPVAATRRVQLEGLDAVAVAALASAHAGAPPGPRLTARLDGAAGNPLYLLEILRALDEDGRTRVRSGLAEIDDDELPRGLRATVVRRVQSLPPEAVDLLRLASLLGRSFTLADLATVAGQRVVDVAARLQPTVDAAVVTGSGDTLSFRHDVLREAIYDDMAPAIRTDLHAAAGRALSHSGAPVLQVARQLELGARPGDLLAVEWLERAAIETAALDVAQAVALFEQALRVAGLGWAGRRRVELAMLEPLAMSGRVADAQALGRRLLEEGLDSADELAVRRGLAVVAASAGDLGSAVEEAAKASAVPGVPPVEAAVLKCLEASMAFLVGRSADEVRATAEETAAVAAREPADEPLLTALAEQALGLVEGAAGYYDRALEHARRSSRAVATPTSRLGYLIPELWEGTFLLHLDRFDEALPIWAAQQRRAEATGAMALLVQTHTATALLHYFAGRWDDGAAELETAQAGADEYGNRAHDVGINAVLAWLGLATADPAATTAALAAGEAALAHARHLMGVEVLLYVKSRVAAESGAVAEAYELLRTAWTLAEPLRGLTQVRYLAPDLVKLALANDDEPGAREVADVLHELAGRSSAISGRAAAVRASGLIDRDADALVHAADLYRSSPRRFEAAFACEDAGRALAAAGRNEEAVALLEEAADLQLGFGATGELARVDSLLRDLGARRRRARRAPAAQGWEALSPTETKVVELVAQGLSNPQIAATLYVSRRTVETHVSHVFRKLEVASRAELAARAATRKR
jgi:class 3 adenylate cyclase/DNA-binding NarL/FixJ family response regulator